MRGSNVAVLQTARSPASHPPPHATTKIRWQSHVGPIYSVTSRILSIWSMCGLQECAEPHKKLPANLIYLLCLGVRDRPHIVFGGFVRRLFAPAGGAVRCQRLRFRFWERKLMKRRKRTALTEYFIGIAVVEHLIRRHSFSLSTLSIKKK